MRERPEFPFLRRYDPDQVQGFDSRHLSPLRDTPRNRARLQRLKANVNRGGADVAGAVMITGQSGTTLTLPGLNKATLRALAGDFGVV